jgi:hypothetical protein
VRHRSGPVVAALGSGRKPLQDEEVLRSGSAGVDRSGEYQCARSGGRVRLVRGLASGSR